MIRNNLFYKLLALGVAVGLWTYVNSEQNPRARRAITVPIELRNLAKGYTSDPNTREATVTIEGLKTVVDSVRREDVNAWIDLGGLRLGAGISTGKFKVRSSVSGVSANDLNISVKPEFVKVRVEALSRKRLPVEVKFLAAPPLGYAYADPQITPASVGISGKVSQVSKVTRVMLPLTGATPNQPIDGYFNVVPVDAKGNVVQEVKLDRDKVRLKLGFIEVPATKAVIVSHNIIGQPEYPFTIVKVSIMPASVTLEGKPSVLMPISTVTTEAVSVQDATETITREVGLRIPAGVRVVGNSKVLVTVYLSKKETDTGKKEPEADSKG